jgi:hypothetical protein
MINGPRLGPALIVVVLVVAGAGVRVDTAQHADEQARVMKQTPGKTFVFDFSGSPRGGVYAGNFNNFAFSLNLREPVRKLSVRSGEPGTDVIATYDYAACSRGQETLLERQIGSLSRGDATFVDYIDIEMLPLHQKDLKWEGGVCYGFRSDGGTWHWRLTSTPLTYDQTSDRVRARVWVKEPGVDAVKLVFDASVPPQYVRTVTVTTQLATKTSRR